MKKYLSLQECQKGAGFEPLDAKGRRQKVGAFSFSARVRRGPVPDDCESLGLLANSNTPDSPISSFLPNLLH
jgi:hypothetical protein